MRTQHRREIKFEFSRYKVGRNSLWVFLGILFYKTSEFTVLFWFLNAVLGMISTIMSYLEVWNEGESCDTTILFRETV